MPLDRDSVQLTSFVAPRMRRPMPALPERDSIYGNTYNGVPNPLVPHQHPYPTRFHGPVFNYPQPGYRYAARPYARAPFNGGPDDPSATAGAQGAGAIILGIGLLVLLGIGVFSLSQEHRARSTR